MPTVVTSEAFTLPCTEMWVDPAELLIEFPTLDPNDAEQIAVDATWLLSALSFDRFHGEQCIVDDYRIVTWPPAPSYTHPSARVRGWGRGPLRINLYHWPLKAIEDISIVDMCAGTIAATGIGTEITNWCQSARNEISLGCTTAWVPACTCSEHTIRVRYTVGNNVPAGAGREAKRLAIEMIKHLTGKPCNLPERITTITRQGATWTVLDPQDFLSKGLIGLPSVDRWLTGINGIGPARLIDGMTQHTIVNTTVVGCDSDCFAALEDP